MFAGLSFFCDPSPTGGLPKDQPEDARSDCCPAQRGGASRAGPVSRASFHVAKVSVAQAVQGRTAGNARRSTLQKPPSSNVKTATVACSSCATPTRSSRPSNPRQPSQSRSPASPGEGLQRTRGRLEQAQAEPRNDQVEPVGQGEVCMARSAVWYVHLGSRIITGRNSSDP